MSRETTDGFGDLDSRPVAAMRVSSTVGAGLSGRPSAAMRMTHDQSIARDATLSSNENRS
jgi:hypothetical protein